MKHAEHPMNAEEATSIFEDMQKRAQEPKNMYGGGQVDASSAHMTDREQWRYYQGKLRVLVDVASKLNSSTTEHVLAALQAEQQSIEEFLHHIQMRIEAKRHGVDYPSDSH